MKNSNTVAIGCYYKVQLTACDTNEESEELVLIGTIFSRVEPENSKNERLLEKADAPRWDTQSWL